MKIRKILSLICLIHLLVGCTPNTNQKSQGPSPQTTMDTYSTTENGDLSDYHSAAVKIISSEKILNGPEQITAYNKQAFSNSSSTRKLFSIEARKERGIDYEIAQFTTSNSETYTRLTIKERENEEKLIIFEFDEPTPKALPKVDLQEIADRRALWIKLCNQHNAAELVNELYSSNTIYYNHKPVLIGRAAVIEDYSYMNNEKYQLTLSPLTLEVVNSTTVFEIGQCKGSYNGKYILIWKKESDGVWRIFIDSNV